jgi:hypothetical protein
MKAENPSNKNRSIAMKTISKDRSIEKKVKSHYAA